MDPLPQYGAHAFIPYLPSPATTLSSDGSTPRRDLPLISLLNSSSWTYCGPLLPLTSANLPPSFHTWSRTTISGPLLPRLLPFLRFINKFLSSAGVENYWLTIRATRPTHEYDCTRWHTDDIFFDSSGEKDRVGLNQNGRSGYWKLAGTLLGPPTLFLKDGRRARRAQRTAKKRECEKRGEHTCSSFRCLGCLEAVESVRQTLAKKFEDQEVVSPAFGEVAFFRLGDSEGAVHSEPKCDVDRIFINVVPGSELELRNLMGRWGLGFPRAWCFGVPVEFDEGGAQDAVNGTGNKVACIDDEDRDLRKKSTSTTMSANVKDEYSDWLKEKGFRFSEVFGRGGGATMALNV
ncbi:hypothetical protein BCR34DRAFT_572739 [Clohesyomyces aquaticus]|uniref:Uncharacterized protein n=1 Tax=Clohesyomyces aquaticus TaxID=1231657 RepID=A0A1Y1Z249_9PLEO|nr:hypothetical protein BCR34DRAFT_572739 [Clohesyomyces aquaticus]